MKRKTKIHWQSSLVITVLLIFLIAAISLIVTRRINNMEEERSFERLEEQAGNLVSDIRVEMADDCQQLELLSTVISEYDDMTSKELWKIIDSYNTWGVISRLELLLPGDVVLSTGGEEISSGGVLSFEKEAAKGAHITDRETDVKNQDQYVVRNYVPVVRDGETVAMLYGVIELGDLPEELAVTSYGEASLYIIDAATGNFLVDTWHNDPDGNIWKLGERKMAPGYDHDQLKQGLINGETGYVVFVSDSIGEYLYFYYEPIGINRWQLALSVPEDAVFETARTIERMMNVLLAVEAVCFALYFLWMIYYVKRETSTKERQLNTINYIYDVEKLLFNAHEQRGNILKALEKVAGITGAECVCLWIFDDSVPEEHFKWCRNSTRMIDGRREEWIFRKLLKCFTEGNSEFAAYDPHTVKKKLSASEEEVSGLDNLIAVPITDMDGGICGILACSGMSDRYVTPELLKNVDFSFSMFCNNLRSYLTIREQGERDLLSGLYNRNRFEIDLPRYYEQYRESLACIYMDVNGLHELNNSQGHDAGDRMLKTVADCIRDHFGDTCSYRIGGDEFLAFAVDREQDDVIRGGRDIAEILEEQDIHLSVGIEWRGQVDSMEDLVKAAERKMYAKKREYYQQASHDRRSESRLLL